MKKILNHLFNGGILVSPGGHTLFTEKLGLIISQNGEKTHIESSMEIIDMFLQYDWEIQREPGVYRVVWLKGHNVELVWWCGFYWNSIGGVRITGQPLEVIERVEAEPKPMDVKEFSSYTSVPAFGDIPYISDQYDLHQSHEDMKWGVAHTFKFKSRIEAELALANCRNSQGSVLERLKQMAGGFVPDWGDEDGGKYFISYNCNEKVWSTTWQFSQRVPGVVYFRTQKEAQAAIDELGEELLG